MADRAAVSLEAEEPVHGVPEGRLLRLGTYAAVAVAALLIAAKLAAWLTTDSVALFTTLIDSTLDLAASGLNLLAVHQALQPADRQHRFGHGKAEPLAGLGQAAFITGSALFVIAEAVHRLIEPQAVSHGAVGIAVMVFSILLTVALVRFQRHVVKRTRSLAINADSLHYATDVMMNAGVIVSLLLSAALGWTFIDPLFALGIAAYILWNAGGIAWQSYNVLMDREFPDEERGRIKAICKGHPQVRNIHDLRTRSAGLQSFIQLHLEMDGELTLRQAHAISDEVERRILEAFPHAEVIIHEDPDDIAEPRPVFK